MQIERLNQDWQRCFIALSPDSDTRAKLSRLPLAPGAVGLARADLHLTLAFLGQLQAEQARLLGLALPGLTAPIPGLEGKRIEYWPDPTRPQVFVATFTLSDALLGLVQRIRTLLKEMKLPVESRAFRPHITLARLRRSGDRPQNADPISHDLPVAGFDALALYARSQTNEGLRYQTLAMTALA